MYIMVDQCQWHVTNFARVCHLSLHSVGFLRWQLAEVRYAGRSSQSSPACE